ncbi:DALR anticodon-binding domain-containing protein [Streptomyces alkaliterrae]|uniref:Arginine--tRNA ligase n=1 Tax=Streptomyces alkaliterrae TaxID=2213162 RepID=A0A5P0YQ39_9ACTN|nr:arginine--tRNA ligase [Streptomyces alkaliterrae]MBB1260761.1 hypothetical protein [Streptomyces alkaliterrae]MQS01542.1 hypothetical protein [Streptomyces alkaliterrae]
MTPAQLSRALSSALRRAVAEGELPRTAAEPPAGVTLRNPPHGDADYASNLALRLAAATGHPARSVADVLRTRLVQEAGVARVEVAGPGFLNIHLAESGWTALVRRIAERGRAERPQDAAPAEDPVRDAERWAAVTGTAPRLERRDGNPLFRVQYAHSRVRALLTAADDLGFAPEPGPYATRAEGRLLTLLADSARIAERCPAPDGNPAAPDHPADPAAYAPLARHLTAVADAFLDLHDAPGARPVLPRGDEKPEAAHRSRLALAEAAGTVLAGGLTQLGISAPHHL